MTKDTQQKKKKGRSAQELIGIRAFTPYGLETSKGELLFFLVSPTNISVLSHTNIEIKIRHLMMVLSAVPDIEIGCTDSCECFDDNKAYLQERLEDEPNPHVCRLLKQDVDFLDHGPPVPVHRPLQRNEVRSGVRHRQPDRESHF